MLHYKILEASCSNRVNRCLHPNNIPRCNKLQRGMLLGCVIMAHPDRRLQVRHSDSTLAIRAKTGAICQNLNFDTSPRFWECNMIYGWEEVSGLLPLQRFCRLLQCRCLPGAERCGVARVWLCARPYVRRVCMPKIGILRRLL